MNLPALCAFLLAAVLAACARDDWDHSIATDCAEMSTRYFSNGLSERNRFFTEADPETQYAMFVCAGQYMREYPGLEREYAEAGASAALFLREKLAETDHDRTIEDIVLVYFLMQQEAGFDIANDVELVGLLRRKASLIDQPWTRRRAMHQVQAIEAGSEQRLILSELAAYNPSFESATMLRIEGRLGRMDWAHIGEGLFRVMGEEGSNAPGVCLFVKPVSDAPQGRNLRIVGPWQVGFSWSDESDFDVPCAKRYEVLASSMQILR